VDKNSRDLEVPTRNLPVGPEDSGSVDGDWQVKTSRTRRKPLDLDIRHYKEDTRRNAEQWTRKGEYDVVRKIKVFFVAIRTVAIVSLGITGLLSYASRLKYVKSHIDTLLISVIKIRRSGCTIRVIITVGIHSASYRATYGRLSKENRVLKTRGEGTHTVSS
jgi:hypothetical protein